MNPDQIFKHTEQCATEDELVPPAFVVLENLDVNYAQDKVHSKKNG